MRVSTHKCVSMSWVDLVSSMAWFIAFTVEFFHKQQFMFSIARFLLGFVEYNGKC